MRRPDDALLGVQHGVAGVVVAPVTGRRWRRPATQLGRLGDRVVGACSGDGADGQRVVDDPLDGRLDQPGREAGGPHLALRLGAHMPDLPVARRASTSPMPPRLWLAHPGVVDVDGWGAAPRQSGHHPRQPDLAEHVDSLGAPRSPLLGAAARGSCLASRVSRFAC